MGGHGFGGGSGMIALNNEYLSKPTVEGDNWMITQQTAAYLIKRMTEVVSKPQLKPTDSVDAQFQAFVQSQKGQHSFSIDQDFGLVQAFRHRASYLTYQVYQARVVQKLPWTDLMLSLHRLSRAYSESLLVTNFYNAVFESTLNPPVDNATLNVMKNLYRLFAIFTLDNSSSEFLLSKALQADQLQHLTPRLQELMKEVRPHAVRLVDAWSIPDYVLESALGSYDGDVYNRLFHKAHKENPLNLQTFNPDWKSEEIVMGEGEANARKRLEALALGVTGHEQAKFPRSKL